MSVFTTIISLKIIRNFCKNVSNFCRCKKGWLQKGCWKTLLILLSEAGQRRPPGRNTWTKHINSYFLTTFLQIIYKFCMSLLVVNHDPFFYFRIRIPTDPAYQKSIFFFAYFSPTVKVMFNLVLVLECTTVA